MEALGTDSHDSQIDRKPIPGPNLPDKMDVVFEIHRARFAAAVAGVVEPDSQIKCVASVIEHNDVVPNIHVLVAIHPFGARYRLVTGRSQFLNLF